jgi:hypothetical protein
MLLMKMKDERKFLMRFQISLPQVIGLFLFYAAFGYLTPIVDLSLNPFAVAPLWVVASDLLVLLIGALLVLLAGRLTPKLKPTRLQWLGVLVVSLVLFIGADLLSSHGRLLLGAFGYGAIMGTIVVLVVQTFSKRSQTSE